MAHHHCRYYVIPYFRFRFRKFSVNPSKQRHSRQQNENESENKHYFLLLPRLVAGLAHSGSVSPSCSDLAAISASYHATLSFFFFYADI